MHNVREPKIGWSPAVLALAAIVAVALVTACTGGGYGSGGTPMYSATNTPVSSQQVIRLALPTSVMGQENDPTFGLVGGYTQSSYSQVLAFAPGTQVMIQNDQTTASHTLGDTGGTSSFPASPPLSTTASGGASLAAGFQSGTIAPNTSIGPITLTAGTYYIGCAFYYGSNQMRDVLLVNASAVPGPQATLAPGAATPDPGDPGFHY
jgi:hypothetical protein